jgi:hypothetical protein
LRPTLQTKLAELENRRESLSAEIDAADQVMHLPDADAIQAKWREIVTNLGSLSERAEPAEVTAARNALQGLLGIVKVDRLGKGYADLSIGVPTSMVAGASFVCRFRPIELRKDHSRYPLLQTSSGVSKFEA